MKNRVNYQQIKTLADIRSERQRILVELDEVERRLSDDYRRVTDMFSVGYVVERVTTGAGKFYSAIEWAMIAYNLVRSAIGRYKDASAHRKNASKKEFNSKKDSKVK